MDKTTSTAETARKEINMNAKKWINPALPGEHRMPARAHYIPYTDNTFSKDAAKELRKGNEALAEARKKEASAVSDQAYYNMKAEEVKAKAELDIVKEQERTKKYAIDLEAKSGAIEKLQELADTGTFDAYRKLTACRESESGFFSLGLKDNNGPKPSEKDIDTIISSFNYTKDSNELNKIVKYAQYVESIYFSKA